MSLSLIFFLSLKKKWRKTERIFVSITTACLFQAKAIKSPAVAGPIPGREVKVLKSFGNFPLKSFSIFSTQRLRYSARRLYPSPCHSLSTSLVFAHARIFVFGNFFKNELYFGMIRSACVCCNMISDTKILYGFFVFRQGRSRLFFL